MSLSTSASPLEIHCLTRKAHSDFLLTHNPTLLRLTETQSVRLFSNTEITLHHHNAYRVDPTTGAPCTTGVDIALNVAQIQAHVTTRWVGHTLIYSREIESTQDVLLRVVSPVKAGWVAVSGWQMNGRGRRGAEWVSPAGSVAMSIAVRIQRGEMEKLTFLQYVAAVAVVDAVEGMEGMEGVVVRIKWPNDLYVEGAKVGGVLCEGVLRGDVFEVVVGVGVNVENREPTTCLREVVERRGGEWRGEWCRERFIGGYLVAFEKVLEEFCRRGWEGGVRERYLDRWLHAGQRVRIEGKGGGWGVVKGLAENGWVRVYREDLGAVQDLAPEVTSLDFEAGVIREKPVGSRVRT